MPNMMCSLAGTVSQLFVAHKQHGLLHALFVVQVGKDVAGGGEREVVAHDDAARPVARRAVQHKPAVYLHRAAQENAVVKQMLRRGVLLGGKNLPQRQRGGLVDDHAHAAFGGIGANIHHAFGKEIILHIGHGDEEMVG